MGYGKEMKSLGHGEQDQARPGIAIDADAQDPHVDGLQWRTQCGTHHDTCKGVRNAMNPAVDVALNIMIMIRIYIYILYKYVAIEAFYLPVESFTYFFLGGAVSSGFFLALLFNRVLWKKTWFFFRGGIFLDFHMLLYLCHAPHGGNGSSDVEKDKQQDMRIDYA